MRRRLARSSALGLLLTIGCGSTGPSTPDASAPATLEPPPSPISFDTILAPLLRTPPRSGARGYISRPDTFQTSLLDAYAVDEETGRLVLFQEVPARTHMLAVHPSRRTLFTDIYTDGLRYAVQAWSIGVDGALVPGAAASAANGGRPVQIAASERAVFLRMDGSSTGYSVWVNAYRFDPQTGGLGWAGKFLSRGGCHCLETEELNGIEVHPSGRFLFDLTARHIVTHRITEESRLVEIDAAALTLTNRSHALATHPRGDTLYVTGSRRDTGAEFLHVYRLDPATGHLEPMQSVPLPGGFEGTPVIAVDPLGRALYVPSASTPRALLTVSLDAAGLPRRTESTSYGEAAAGGLTVDPLGRFLYVSSDSGIWAWRIDAEGSLAGLDKVAAAGGLRLTVLAAR